MSADLYPNTEGENAAEQFHATEHQCWQMAKFTAIFYEYNSTENLLAVIRNDGPPRIKCKCGGNMAYATCIIPTWEKTTSRRRGSLLFPSTSWQRWTLAKVEKDK